MIYLDYAATTPVAPQVADLMANFLTQEGNFANPAARTYQAGWLAEQAVEKARQQVASLLAADVREIIFTSGATEANNLAILGAARANPSKKHLITSAIEHKAVLDVCHYLESKQGYQVTYLQPNQLGQITPEAVAEALQPDTLLVALMLVNNELGSISPLAEISQLVAANNSLLHIDAAQAAGKLPLDVQELGASSLAISAHKFYGPKGVGALYIQRSPKANIKPITFGGGQEKSLRPGTLATHQLAGMGLAAELAQQRLEEDARHLQACREALLAELNPSYYQATAAGKTYQAGQPLTAAETWQGILNLNFKNIEAENLMMALPSLAMSTGSACNADSLDPSYVLVALGLSRQEALSSLRISLGRYLTLEEAQQAGQQINQLLEKFHA